MTSYTPPSKKAVRRRCFTYGCFYESGGPFWGILRIRALPLWVYFGGTDSWKLPYLSPRSHFAWSLWSPPSSCSNLKWDFEMVLVDPLPAIVRTKVWHEIQATKLQQKNTQTDQTQHEKSTNKHTRTQGSTHSTRKSNHVSAPGSFR